MAPQAALGVVLDTVPLPPPLELLPYFYYLSKAGLLLSVLIDNTADARSVG